MFRVLALDGGGIKGAFTAGALIELERQTGKRIADHFDLIVGTSTGGILALGLGLGMEARELLSLYVEHGEDIFSGSGFFGGKLGPLRQLFGAKHRQETLRAVLSEYLGAKQLGHSTVALVIPTYEAVFGRPYLMKTAHHPRFNADFQASAVDVALATSAAPTYFNAAPFPLRPGESYLDGGLWANSPAMVGLVEAVSFLGQPLDQVDMLSIGTTDVARTFGAMKNAGALRWNVGLIEVLMSAQSSSALAQASLLLSGRLLRIDLLRPAGLYSLDGATREKILELAALGRASAAERDVVAAARERFLNGTPAPKYQPAHALS